MTTIKANCVKMDVVESCNLSIESSSSDSEAKKKVGTNEETEKEDQTPASNSTSINMTQQQVIEASRCCKLILATNYDIFSKRVSLGYDPITLEVKVVLQGEKKRVELSAEAYRDFDEEGSMWKVLNVGQSIHRKCVVSGEKSMRVTSLRRVPHVVFHDRITNVRIPLDLLELQALSKLRCLISSNLFTLTVNRANVIQFCQQYIKKSAERGCYLKYSDFELPINPVYGIDYLRLFLEYPLCYDLKMQLPTHYNAN